MTNEEKNTALYKKMFAEQETFKNWLLTLAPDEILSHAYEYITREDILLAMEYNDLSDNQADALLRSPCPISDIYQKWEKQESSYMDEIWNTVEHRANEVIRDAFIKSRQEDLQ